MSHPSWVCGLKLCLLERIFTRSNVTPFVGVWIETFESTYIYNSPNCHTLRGCVD